MSEYKYRKTFTIGYTKEGKPIRKDVKTNNKKQFIAKCKVYETLISDDVNVQENQQTVEEWAWKWFNIYKKPMIAISQQKNIDALLRLHILPVIGYLKMGNVRSYHLQDLMNRQAGKSNSQIQKIRSILSQMFQRAELDHIITFSPAGKLYSPNGTQKERRHLTDDERAGLYQAIQGHRGYLYVRLMLECGLRRGETIPLKWKDVDFEQGILRIDKAVEYDNEYPRVKLPKTKSGIRYVPIPPDLLQKLGEYKRIRKESNDHLVIYNRSGEMYKQTQLARLWRSIRLKWDIALGAKRQNNRTVVHALDPCITPHYLRHTYCTDLRRRGVSLREAQALMGHSDIRTTANIYDHFDLSDVIATGKRLYTANSAEDEDAKKDST